MNVSLSAPLEAYVNQKVDSGLYNSASEVIREALRLLQEKEAARERKARLDELLMSRLAKVGENTVTTADAKQHILDSLNHTLDTE